MTRTVKAIVLVALVACSGAQTTTSTTTATTTTAASTTTTVEPLVDCPAITYRVPSLPERVAGQTADMASIELDEFTAIGGTTSVFWVDSDGSLTIALIRGTLPPKPIPGDYGEIEIAGNRARVAPLDDGKWVAAWSEGAGERCDLYTMVFYPPIEPKEVETALLSITKP